jgi:UDP-N-acetylmuramoyl-tripeptide--D-alanyl-D-alanine ligase
MKSGDIAAITGGVLKGPPRVPVAGFCTDSRKVKEGDLFVAIRGRRFDGNDFAISALEGGAAGVLVSRELEPPPGRFAVIVGDTIRALGKLAKKKRGEHTTTFIGVAGSAGKTTTKELIHHLLSHIAPSYKSEGNLNTEIGLPLSLLNMRGNPRFGVFELGATRVGDVAYLRDILKPSVRVITAIGEEHLESFLSLENVIRGNGEILEEMEDDHLAVVPYYTRNWYRINRGRVFYFGEGSGFEAGDINISVEGTSFTLLGERFTVPVLGRGIVDCALASLRVLSALGYDPREFRERLSSFEGVEGRMKLINFEYFYVIDDTYNSNPLSLKNALYTLSLLNTGGKKIAVLGDMLELGKRSEELHRKIGKITTEFNIDYVLFYGKEMEKAYRERVRMGGKSFYSEEKENIAVEMLKWTNNKNIILIKGSRGMYMEYFLSFLKEKKAHG